MVQDTEAAVERAKAMASENDGWSVEGRSKNDKLLRRQAHVPWAVIAQWEQNLGVRYFDPNHQDAVNRLLDSSDWRDLRTAHYRIGRQGQWV